MGAPSMFAVCTLSIASALAACSAPSVVPPDDGTGPAMSDGGGDLALRAVCPYGDCSCVDHTLCEQGAELVPGAPLTMQDTRAGGSGDCIMCASCGAGRSLYYRITLPAMRWTKIVAAPADTNQDLLVRILSACSPTGKTLESARGGRVTMGSAGLCIRNDEAVDRRAILAAGLYGGGGTELTTVFNLTAEVRPPNEGCSL